MKIKLLFFSIFILGNFTKSFCDLSYGLPVFYDKNEQKFYGLFAHYHDSLHNGWLPIKVPETPYEKRAQGDYAEYYDFLENLFQDQVDVLFKNVAWGKDDIFIMGLRTSSVYLIPVKQFVRGDVLNQFVNNEIDEFVWLDLNQFIGNKSGNIIKGNNKTYHVDSEEFNYHFSINFPAYYLKSKQAEKYMNLMEQTTQQAIPEQPISLRKPARATKPVKEPQRLPKKEVVHYPYNVKDEYRFFYDAYYNSPENLKRNIEFARNARTLNEKVIHGGVYHTPLTYALYKLSDKSSPETIEILLSNGVDPTIPDSYGFPPLFYAVKLQHDPEIIQLLLEYGANPSVIPQPSEGVAKQLIALDIDPITAGYGRSPIDLETREDVKLMLQGYIGGIKKPITKPSFEPAMQPSAQLYGNSLENKMQQLKDTLMQLEQKLMR
jgi:hypothetical protein